MSEVVEIRMDEEGFFIFVDENGKEDEFEVLCEFDYNGKDYIALGSTENEDEILLYEYAESEDGCDFIDIEDDDEYEEAFQEFCYLMDEE